MAWPCGFLPVFGRRGAGNGQEREAIASFCTAQKLDCLFPDDVLREAISREGARSIYYSYDFHLTVEAIACSDRGWEPGSGNCFKPASHSARAKCPGNGRQP
jgi:hypothetical protein